jgi:lipooligosaccharide transport system ATP-binding protein
LPEPAITLRGVVKRYGPITAVDGLDLDVPEGTCVGLLGPHGAGKSTTMRMLTAQTVADEGTIRVLGHELPGDSKFTRAQMGVVPQLDNLDIALTVEENLLVFAHLYGLPRRERRDAVQRALEIANLAERRHTRVDKLSGGMRRRLLIARALLHRPQLLLLDEPTASLDPATAQDIRTVIRDIARNTDTGVLWTSHNMYEVEALAAQRGWRTRRTGTSISVLHANGDQDELDGERRITNLEDVFVLLTGEEIS